MNEVKERLKVVPDLRGQDPVTKESSHRVNTSDYIQEINTVSLNQTDTSQEECQDDQQERTSLGNIKTLQVTRKERKRQKKRLKKTA